MTTGTVPIRKTILYLVPFHRVASFPSGYFAVTDRSNKWGQALPPNQLLVFECMKLKAVKLNLLREL